MPPSARPAIRIRPWRLPVVFHALSELRIEYRLRFVRAAWVFLVMVIAVNTVLSLKEGTPLPVGRMLAFLATAWAVGFGVIRYRAHAFVPAWLRRSATQPEA